MNDQTFMIRCPGVWIDAVDAWRAEQPAVPSRAEAIRYMVAMWLYGQPHDATSEAGKRLDEVYKLAMNDRAMKHIAKMQCKSAARMRFQRCAKPIYGA